MVRFPTHTRPQWVNGFVTEAQLPTLYCVGWNYLKSIPKLKGATAKVREWINNFIPQCTCIVGPILINIFSWKTEYKTSAKWRPLCLGHKVLKSVLVNMNRICYVCSSLWYDSIKNYFNISLVLLDNDTPQTLSEAANLCYSIPLWTFRRLDFGQSIIRCHVFERINFRVPHKHHREWWNIIVSKLYPTHQNIAKNVSVFAPLSIQLLD